MGAGGRGSAGEQGRGSSCRRLYSRAGVDVEARVHGDSQPCTNTQPTKSDILQVYAPGTAPEVWPMGWRS